MSNVKAILDNLGTRALTKIREYLYIEALRREFYELRRCVQSSIDTLYIEALRREFYELRRCVQSSIDTQNSSKETYTLTCIGYVDKTSDPLEYLAVESSRPEFYMFGKTGRLGKGENASLSIQPDVALKEILFFVTGPEDVVVNLATGANIFTVTSTPDFNGVKFGIMRQKLTPANRVVFQVRRLSHGD
jgi:hypothetical protein